MYRLGEALCAIQGGRHVTVYAGAWGLCKRMGLDPQTNASNVRKLLHRLVRDEVLQVVRWSEKGGRFADDEKPGGPGIAHGYELGRATLPNGVQSHPVNGVRSHPLRVVENPEGTGSIHTPFQEGPNGVRSHPPTLSTPSLTLGRTSGRKDGIGKEGTPKRTGGFRRRAVLSPDALIAERDQTPPGLRALFRDVDSEKGR